MVSQTDLQQIKKVAHTFLMLEPQSTDYTFIVKHPYTDSAFVTLEVGKKEYIPVNILEDSTAMNKWRDNVSRMIENAKNPRQVYMGLTKSYRFAFLKYAMPYMSQKDFSEYLADAWVLCEAPNSDPNFTKRQMIGLFQKADPRVLMSDDEYDRLQNLEAITTVYRGVTEYNSDKVKALSWTLNPETAKWFAHRFDENGTVYKARISKAHILAFFNSRNESEVIVDPRYLMNITEVQGMNNEQRIKAFNNQNPPFYIVDHEDGEFSLCFPLSFVPEEYGGFGQEAFNQYALQISDPIMERGFYTHGDGYEWEEVFKKAFESDSNIGKIEFDCEASGFFCCTDDLSLLEDFGSRFRAICMDKEGFTDLVCVALKEAAIRQAEEAALSNTLRGFFMECPHADAEIRTPDGDIKITAEKGQQLIDGTVESVLVNGSVISADEFLGQEITHYRQDLFSDNHFQIKTRWSEPSLQETENDESMNLC